MLKYGNKEFRNLQEQVLENMKDIANLQEGTAVLSEFGIKVVGEVETVADLPTVLEYKSEHEDWAYGDAYAVGTASPYTLYILTRENDTHDEDYWFDIGVFPAPGPQGEQGPKGDQGVQGQTGATGEPGASAGFGSVTATAETLSSGSPATASVAVSGPDTAKEFAFTFGIPQNTPAGFTHYITITPNGATSGTLGQSEYNILYDNYDSIIRLRVGSQTINYYFLKKWSVTDDYMRYICLWSVNNTDTRYYLITIDRSNRNWTLASGEPFKVSQYNINSGSATSGQVLTADGSGGASWLDAGGSGLEVVTLTQSTSTLSDDDYNKLNGDNAIIKFVSSADGWTKYFKKYKDDGTYIYYYQVSQEDGSGTFFGGFRIVKSTKYCASLNSYLKVSTSNINSGSTIANQYLTSNGSGGATWTSGPSFTQVQADWNQTNINEPDYIKNKPTIPSGTVTSVGLSAASGSNLSVSGSPVTSSGSMTVGVASGYSIPSTTDQSMWNGDMKYKGKVGNTIFGADINWNDLLSSGTAVKKGDTYYVSLARITTPVCSLGNFIVAESDGTGASTTWKVVPTGSISTISLGGTAVSGIGTLTINTGTAYNSATNKLATMSDLPTVDQTYNSSSSNAQSGVAVASAISGKVNSVVPTTETWTFTLSNNTTVTKTVVTGITVS